MKLSALQHVRLDMHCTWYNKFRMSFSYQAGVARRSIYHEEEWQRPYYLSLARRAVYRVRYCLPAPVLSVTFSLINRVCQLLRTLTPVRR